METADAKTKAFRVCVAILVFGLFALWNGLLLRGATLLNLTKPALDDIQSAKIPYFFVVALASLLIPFFQNVVNSRKRQWGFVTCMTAFAIVGMACCALSDISSANPLPSSDFGLALAGLACAMITPLFGRIFFDIGPKATTLCVLAGYLFSSIAAELIWSEPVLARFVITLSLPLFQAVLLLYYIEKLADNSSRVRWVQKECDSFRYGLTYKPLPTALLIAVLLSGFMGSFVRGTMYYSGVEYSSIAAESLILKIAVLAVFIVILAVFGRGYDTFSLFWPWAALPMLICCLALPFFESANPVIISTTFTILHNLCNVFNYTVFVDIATRYDRNPVTVFCWGRAFDSCGAIIGFVLGSAFAVCFSLSTHSWYMLSIVSSFAIVAIILLVLRSRRAIDLNLPSVSETIDQGAFTPADSHYEELAARYGLTVRETEVLRQLDEGRSIPYIAESMYLSTSTVKTHVSSIYRKLNVHSRQEFLNLVRGK